MRLFFTFLFVAFTIITWLQSGNTSLSSLVLMFGVCLLCSNFIYKVRSLRDEFCTIYVFFYLFCSHTIVLVFPTFFNIGDQYISRFWIFVHILYVIFFATCLLFRHRKKSFQNDTEVQMEKVTKMQWNTLIVFMFSLSFISFSLGLSKMGTAQDVYLPFHLAGIINYTRMSVIPVIYPFFLIRTYNNSPKRTFNKYLFVYFLWLLVETFVRLSRGVLVSSIIDLGIIFILVGTLKIKDLIRYALPIVLISVALFPIVSALRSISGDNKLSTNDLSKATKSETQMDDTIRDSFLRMFSTVSFYDRIYTIIDKNSVFDFTRAPIILAMGGSHYYVTSEVDQRGLDEGHNSGSTGIIDSLLFGGYGFCYIVFFLSVAAMTLLDTKKIINRPFIRYILFSLFIWFIRYRSVSYFLDSGVVVQLLVSGSLLYFFIVYYRRAPKKSVRSGAVNMLGV